MGIKPPGDSGTYLQHFFVNVHYISDSSFVESDGKYFRNNKDILVMPFGAGDTTITAQAVFCPGMDLKTMSIQTTKEST